jgi:hypothetical protein
MIEEFILITGGFLFGVIMTSTFWVLYLINSESKTNNVDASNSLEFMEEFFPPESVSIKEQKARDNGTYTFDSQKDFEEWVSQEKEMETVKDGSSVRMPFNKGEFTVD